MQDFEAPCIIYFNCPNNMNGVAIISAIILDNNKQHISMTYNNFNTSSFLYTPETLMN